jgi:hypothetical protein
MSQQPDEFRTAVMGRLVAGTLVQENVDFRKTEYIAFSHVWGEPHQYAWREITGIPFPIIISESKARFLEANLRQLVGEGYFWMDVICVDQHDDPESTEKRVALTSVYPEIFNRASKTIVIRDGLGFKRCCAAAFGEFSSAAAYGPAINRFGHHFSE